MESGNWRQWDNPTCDRVAGMKMVFVDYLVMKQTIVVVGVNLVEWNCMMSRRIVDVKK